MTEDRGTDRAGRSDVVRVLLVDDHALFRRGLRVTLELEPDMVVVGESGDGADAAGDAPRAPLHDGTAEVLWVHARRVGRLEAERDVAARLARLTPAVPTVLARARALDVTDLESLRDVGEDLATGPAVSPRTATR